MPGRRRYLPRTPNPFAKFRRGGNGDSARHWNIAHTTRLKINFSADRPLYSTTTAEGLLKEDLIIDPGSRLGSKLQQRLGLPWDQIARKQYIGNHYGRLLYLATPRQKYEDNHIATSPLTSSQATVGTAASSPAGRTPLRPNGTALSSPDPIQTDVCSPPKRRVQPQHRLKPTTPSKAAPAWLDIPEPSTVSSISDSTFVHLTSPDKRVLLSQDKPEPEVEYAAIFCLDVVGEALDEVLEEYGLNVAAEKPGSALVVVVQGVRCRCNPDILFSLAPHDEIGDAGKKGIIYGEVCGLPTCFALCY